MSAVGAGATGAGRPGTFRTVGAREFARRRDWAYWTYIVLSAVGAIALVRMLVGDVLRDPFDLMHVAGWALWGLLAYAIVTRADLNWSVLGRARFAAVAWGVFAVMYSGQLITWAEAVFPVSAPWSAAVHAPLPEELVKLLGVVLIAFNVPAVFGRPLGALTVGMLTGLGFAIVENLERTLGSGGAGSAGQVGLGRVGLDRVVLDRGAGQGGELTGALSEYGGYGAAWAHPTFTGVAALGVWCVVAFGTRAMGARIVVAVAFVLLALLLHFLSDSLGPAFGSEVLVIGYQVALLVLLLAVVWWARRVEVHWFRTFTAGGLPPVLDATEAASLVTRRSRRRARGAGASRQVQQTQVRYVNAVADDDASTAEDLLHRERLLRIGWYGQQAS